MSFKGRHWSDEAKAKSRLSHLGKKYRPMSEQGKLNMSLSRKKTVSNAKGKTWKVKDTSRMKGRIGEKHHLWIKDRSKLAKKQLRNDTAYKEWRKNVWIRDSFKCKILDKNCNGKIEAHHILSWKDYPELRYEIKNGITLCHFHHPRKREEEKRLSPYFMQIVSVSKE